MLDASGRLLGPTTPARARHLVASGGVVSFEAAGVFGLVLVEGVVGRRNLGPAADAAIVVALSWFASGRLGRPVICSSHWQSNSQRGGLHKGAMAEVRRGTIRLDRSVLREYRSGGVRARGLLGVVEHETCHITHPARGAKSDGQRLLASCENAVEVRRLAYKLEEVRCEARRIADGLGGTRELLREARWVQYGCVDKEAIGRRGGGRAHGVGSAAELLGAVRDGLFGSGEVDLAPLGETFRPGTLEAVEEAVEEACALGDGRDGATYAAEVELAKRVLGADPYLPAPPFAVERPARREDFKTRKAWKERTAPPALIEWRPLGGLNLGPDDDLGLGEAVGRIEAFAAAAAEGRTRR